MFSTEFDYKKATQALNFLAIKEGGKIGKLNALKLIWLADRVHLRKYGRPIFNDNYLAMPYGPVASSVKDIAEASDFMADVERDYSEKYLDRSNVIVKSKADIDDSVFSETDLHVLNFVYKKFGKIDLVRFSHEFPEWKKHEDNLKVTSRESMSYLDFFENPEKPIAADVFNEQSSDLDDARQIFEESYKLANFWFPN